MNRLYIESMRKKLQYTLLAIFFVNAAIASLCAYRLLTNPAEWQLWWYPFTEPFQLSLRETNLWPPMATCALIAGIALIAEIPILIILAIIAYIVPLILYALTLSVQPFSPSTADKLWAMGEYVEKLQKQVEN